MTRNRPCNLELRARPSRFLPDAIWSQAAAHFDEKQLAGIVTAIAMANAWNRLNVPTGQVTGEWIAQYLP